MKMYKRKICLIITVVMGLSLTACTTKTSQTEVTPYYSVTIDGEKKYYSDEDSTIMKLKEVTEEFVVAAGQANYQKPDEVEGELSYYTDEIRSLKEETDYVNRINAMITGYELQTHISDKVIKKIKLSSQHGNPMATVACEYIVTIQNATDEYLEELQLKKDTKYRRTMTIEYKKVNDEWKVSDNSVSEREEVQ